MERILEALKKNRENAIWGAVALAVVIGGRDILLVEHKQDKGWKRERSAT